MSKALLTFLSLFICALPASSQQFWRTFYYLSGPEPVSALPWSKYTHAIQYALQPNSDCSINDSAYNIASLQSAFVNGAHGNGVKALVSLVDTGYLTTCTDSSHVAGFASNLANYVNSRNYDGIDLDWEGGFTQSNYEQLIVNLRSLLPSPKLITLASYYSNRQVAADQQSRLDRIGIMNYDEDMFYSPSGSSAASTVPNSSIIKAGAQWATADEEYYYYVTVAGISPAKLSLGIPFYGRLVQGCLSGYGTNGNCSRGVTAPDQTFATCCAGTNGNTRNPINYNTLTSSQYASGTYTWDATHDIEYYQYRGSSASQDAFVSFTGPKQVGAAVQWAQSNGYGGVFSYEANFEYMSGATGDARWPLSSALYNAAVGTSSAPTITTSSPLPAGTVGIAYSQTLAAGGSTPITWSLTGGSLPAGLTLGASTGVISGTPSIAGTSSFTVQAANSAGTSSASLSITIGSAAVPVITTTSPLPAGTMSVPYSLSLTATGPGPITWSLASGSLPSGLTLSSSGVISGTPAAAGVFSFTVKAANSGGSASAALSLTIARDPYSYWKLDDGSGTSAVDSSGNGKAANLYGAPSWLSGASCAAGGCVAFNGTSQYGSAALDLSGTSVVTVAFWMKWNGYGNDDRLALEFSPNFNNSTTGFMIDPNSSASGGGQFEAGLKGDAGYNQVIFARPSAGAWHHYAFVFDKRAAAAGQVTPYVDGLAVAYTRISSAANTNSFGANTLYLMSRSGSSLFGAGTLDEMRVYARALSPSEIQSLASTAPAITTPSPLPPAVLAQAYSQTMSASSNTPVTWKVAAGSLPAGVALSASGVLSGTPTAAGNFSFTVQAANSSGVSSAAYSLTVQSPPVITTASPLPAGTAGTPYSQTFTASGSSPITWTVSAGTLPAGLTLSGSGVLSGKPTGAGTFSFTVQATNAVGSATKALSLTINAQVAASVTGAYASWTLDNGSGTVATDSSGNSNTATLYNTPAWLSGSNCVLNGCVAFNGSNQYGAAALNLSDTAVVTVAFWMKWNSFANDDRLAFEFTPNFNNATTGFMVDPNSSAGGGGKFEAGLKGSAGYNQVLFARPSAGVWHHYTFVFNKTAAAANQVTPYVDGVAVPYTKTTSAANTGSFGSSSLYFMSRAGSSLCGAGALDSAQIYKRALTASEIQTLATR